MELENEAKGKVIRVYWAKDKGWFTGQVTGARQWLALAIVDPWVCQGMITRPRITSLNMKMAMRRS